MDPIGLQGVLSYLEFYNCCYGIRAIRLGAKMFNLNIANDNAVTPE